MTSMRQRPLLPLGLLAAALLTLSACGEISGGEDSSAMAAGVPSSAEVSTVDTSIDTTVASTASAPTTIAAVPLSAPAPASTVVMTEAAARPTTTTTVPDDDPSIGGGSASSGGSGASTGTRIEIPKIGLSQTLHEGVALSVLDLGLGHWPGTAMPGQNGNMVIAGHRMSHGHVFRDLDLLVPGDQLIATSGGTTHTYEVTGTQIVNPDAIWITNATSNATATLFACHPKGSTRQRIVVSLALV